MGLTDRQERFCQEYIIDLNGTQAAIRAGYSEKTARQIASELLTKPDIQARIQEIQKQLKDKLEVTQERVLEEYARIAFCDTSKLYDGKGHLIDITELDEDTRRAISGLEIAVERNRDDDSPLTYIHKIKLADKKGALDSLSRHLGMFNDNLNLRADKTLADLIEARRKK